MAISDGKAESRAHKPAAATIRNGEYLLSRRLYLYTAERVENPLAQRFVTFALGKGGQVIVMRDGFVSPTLEPATPREPVASLASNPPAARARPAPPEPRPSPTPAAAPPRPRVAEPTPAPTPRARAEAATPKPTPTPRPPRPAVSRPAAGSRGHA